MKNKVCKMKNVKKSLNNGLNKRLTFVLAIIIAIPMMLKAQKTSSFEVVKIRTSAQCAMCKDRIESALAYEKGIKSSNLDVKTKMLEVVYNPKKTDLTKIKRAINKAGYDADETKADADAYAKLPDCCKKKTCSPGCGGHKH